MWMSFIAARELNCSTECKWDNGIGYAVYPGDCSMFVQCDSLHGHPLVQQCPWGLLWSLDALQCTFPYMSECGRFLYACDVVMYCWQNFGPRQANLVLIVYASSEGSGEPAHPRSLARTFAAPSYKQWVKRNLQTESQIPSPAEWLGMRS